MSYLSLGPLAYGNRLNTKAKGSQSAGKMWGEVPKDTVWKVWLAQGLGGPQGQVTGRVWQGHSTLSTHEDTEIRRRKESGGLTEGKDMS